MTAHKARRDQCPQGQRPCTDHTEPASITGERYRALRAATSSRSRPRDKCPGQEGGTSMSGEGGGQELVVVGVDGSVSIHCITGALCPVVVIRHSNGN